MFSLQNNIFSKLAMYKQGLTLLLDLIQHPPGIPDPISKSKIYTTCFPVETGRPEQITSNSKATKLYNILDCLWNRANKKDRFYHKDSGECYMNISYSHPDYQKIDINCIINDKNPLLSNQEELNAGTLHLEWYDGVSLNPLVTIYFPIKDPDFEMCNDKFFMLLRYIRQQEHNYHKNIDNDLDNSIDKLSEYFKHTL